MWQQYCDNPQAIEHLYGTVPALDTIDVHEVILQRDGPCVQLRVELPRFPDRPPAKWPRSANAVQMALALVGVSDLRLDSWGASNRGAIAIERTENRMLRFVVATEALRLTGLCLSIQIGRFSAYENIPDRTP